MLDFFNKYKWWLGGGAAGLGGLWWLAGRSTTDKGGQPSPSPQPSQPKVSVGAASPSLPFFVMGGAGAPGGTPVQASAATLPLGGEVWQTSAPPLAENPDYAIAQLNANVALAQIDAQKHIADKLMGSGETAPPPPASSTPTAPPMSQMVNELAANLASGNVSASNPASILPIYEYAKRYDLSAATVAQGFNLATNGATNFTGSDINAYIQQYLGQPLLD